MTTDLHSIRLREPWQHERTSAGVVHRRGFALPTGLAACQEVWLVVEGLASQGTLQLGAHRLGAVGGSRRTDFCVTCLLAPRNQIAIELPGAEDLSWTAEVRLEIRH